jgi:hypothetical protein
MQALDRISAQKGHIYSLPKAVDAQCYPGKTYHFWYTAYLARKAVRDTKDKRTAMVAAFQVAKAYRIFNYDGGQALKITKDDVDKPFSYIVRADFAYQAAGAVFGANSSTPYRAGEINLDHAIELLIRSTGQGSVSSLSYIASAIDSEAAPRLEQYRSWINFLNPNVAFNLLSSGNER